MNKLLMILTHDRRDCLDINLRLHEAAGSLRFFDRVVFLLNGVSRRHMRFVDRFIARHPETAFDKVLGDGTRPRGISEMQNRCVRKYPDSFYAKTDEDVFVPEGWAERMFEAYQAHRERDDLALVTALVPNNAYGLYRLLHDYYPEYLSEHRRRFHCDPSPEPHGLTWQSPAVGEWATRLFLNLARANERHRDRLHEKDGPRFHLFSKYFSIGCIGYDYAHWRRMGGVPWNDEPGWCAWIEENRQVNVLDNSQIVLHYTFFVQQQWLDRTSLIEDIRTANLPDTVSSSVVASRWIPRAARLIRQIPQVVKRRLGRE